MGKEVEQLRYTRRISPRTIDEQHKARALLRDIAAAGDDGIGIGNLIFGPQRHTPGGKVMDVLTGLQEAGAIYRDDEAMLWRCTRLGDCVLLAAEDA